MNLIKIGSYIAEKRKAKGLTQTDLGNILGVSAQSVSRWEKGLSFPTTEKLPLLCETLEISLSSLIKGEEVSNANDTNTTQSIISEIKENQKKQTRTLFLLLPTFLLSAILLIALALQPNYFYSIRSTISVILLVLFAEFFCLFAVFYFLLLEIACKKHCGIALSLILLSLIVIGIALLHSISYLIFIGAILLIISIVYLIWALILKKNGKTN